MTGRPAAFPDILWGETQLGAWEHVGTIAVALEGGVSWLDSLYGWRQLGYLRLQIYGL